MLTARRSDRLEALAHELTDPLCLPGDLTDPSHRQALVETIEERHGRLDVLINNAGSCDAGPLEEQTLEELTSVIELNLVATIDLCRLAAPLLFRAPSPSVVNIASVYGVVASRPAMAAYNATKGALVNFSRHLAAQWGPRGVRVNALAPGYFPTELTGMLTDEGLAASIRDRTLLGRPPTMAEIDGPLLFLVSDASSYVNGAHAARRRRMDVCLNRRVRHDHRLARLRRWFTGRTDSLPPKTRRSPQAAPRWWPSVVTPWSQTRQNGTAFETTPRTSPSTFALFSGTDQYQAAPASTRIGTVQVPPRPPRLFAQVRPGSTRPLS